MAIRTLPIFMGGWLVIILMTLVGCNREQSTGETDTYICPMHPTVISDHPSTCPVCGMDLVRKAKPGEEVEITEDLARLLKSPNESIIADIKTVKGEFRSGSYTIHAEGIVTYDTRKLYAISSRISGRLERFHVKSLYQQIKQGQKIADIYSPELQTLQRELLFLLENDSGNYEVIHDTQERLRLLGASKNQIDELLKSKKISTTFSVFSHVSGFVIDGNTSSSERSTMSNSTPVPSSGMNGSMNTMRAPTNTSKDQNTLPSELTIREGDYVNAGQTLLYIARNDAMRVEIKSRASESTLLKPGNKLQLEYQDGNTGEGTVESVEPFVEQGNAFVTIRILPDKTQTRSIGELVKTSFTSQSTEALWVPKQAVIDLGHQKIVFVKSKKSFTPKPVVTGSISHDAIEIKQGLASSDEIASNAMFLVDSESFIKLKAKP